MSDPSAGSPITWVSDPAGVRERIGPAWSTWTGADPAGDLGGGWQRRIHPDDLAGYLRRTARARADGAGRTESYRLRHADGTDHSVVEHAVAAGDRWVGVAVPDAATTGAGTTDAGFRRLAEHTGDVIGRHAADGTWLWISPSVRRVAGYRPRDVVGRHPRDVVHPDDADALDTALGALTEDAPAELVLRLRRADGVHRWFAMHARLVRDERTGAVEMHTSQRDVTDQLLAEEELARFRGLADRAADLIAISTADGTSLYVNPAGREMLGLPRTRPVAAVTMTGCVAPADRRRFDGVLAEMESTGTWAGPMRLVDTAGIVIPVWLAGAVHRDQRGRTAFYSVVAQDLRERRGGEPALQAERERYRSLVAQAPVGIWVGDRTGATTFVNDHMTELAGRDLPGLAGVEHIVVDDREAVAASWGEAVATGSGWQHEFRVVTPAGDERVVTTTARPLHDTAGAVTGFLGTTTDVTGQRAAERARREAEGQQAARRVSDAAAARLRAMVEGLAAIVWEAEWDPGRGTLRFTFVSDRAEELLGHPAHRWIGDPDFWPGLIHPADRDTALEFTARRTSRGQDHDLTYRACAADGRAVWLHQVVHVVGDPDGTLRAQGLTVDVTEQKRAERSSQILAETGRLLGDTGGVEQKLGALVRFVVNDFGDAAVVSLSGPEGLLRRAAAAHDDPRTERALLRVPPAPPTPGLLEALGSGAPVVLPATEVPVLRSALTVPLRIEGRFAGVLSFLVSAARPQHDDADLDLAAELGRRTSLMWSPTGGVPGSAPCSASRPTWPRPTPSTRPPAGSWSGCATSSAPTPSACTWPSPTTACCAWCTASGTPTTSSAATPRSGPTTTRSAGPGGAHRRGDLDPPPRRLGALLPRVADLRHRRRPARRRRAAAAVRRGGGRRGRDQLRHPPDLPRRRAGVRPRDGGAGGSRAGARRRGGRAARDRRDPADQPAAADPAGARTAVARGSLPARCAGHPRGRRLVRRDPPRRRARRDRGRRRRRAGHPGRRGDGAAAQRPVGVPAGGPRPGAGAGPPRPVRPPRPRRGRQHGHLPGPRRGQRRAHLGPGRPSPAAGARPGGPRLLEDAAGTVLAVRGRPPYVPGHARIASGDSVVLYTDGLVERRGEVVDDGLERLCAAGTTAHRLPPAALAEALLAAGLAAGLDGGPTDDVALIVARSMPAPLRLDLPADGSTLRGLRAAVTAWSHGPVPGRGLRPAARAR